MAEKKGGDGENMDLSDSLENNKDEAPDSVDLGFSSEEQEKENVDDSINSSVVNSSKNVVSCMGSQNPNIISESDEVCVKACTGSRIQSVEEGDE